METNEIYAALKTHRMTKNCIDRVCPIDELPPRNKLKYNSDGITFLVVNLDASYLPGSHWVALCIPANKKNIAEYFDSYGKKPKKIIRDYLGGNYINQKRELQGLTSTICGQWCIYYIWERCRGYTLSEITNSFKGKTKDENDEIVNETVNLEFTGEDEPIVDQEFWSSQTSKSLEEVISSFIR
jgi:hypothetical protein